MDALQTYFSAISLLVLRAWKKGASRREELYVQ